MNAKNKAQAGFTIVEVIIAIIVLTVGLLGLVTTAALVTRMITRGQRAAVSSSFAQRRLELLRNAACIPAQRANGSDTLRRGSTWVAINTWTFTANPNSPTIFRLKILTTSKTIQERTRVDTMETTIPC
jgi:prepilin-type N-terminal cleavage/methylation domain-containing protein